MRYEFSCTKCGAIRHIECSMKEYDERKAKQWCCHLAMEPVIYGGLQVHMREPFEKGYKIAEHAVDDPVYCRDKAHLKDICAESGTTSRFLEDDM